MEHGGLVFLDSYKQTGTLSSTVIDSYLQYPPVNDDDKTRVFAA